MQSEAKKTRPISPNSQESLIFSDDEDTGKTVLETRGNWKPQPCQKRTASSLTDSPLSTLRKGPAGVASKDEWADSSDEEENIKRTRISKRGGNMSRSKSAGGNDADTIEVKKASTSSRLSMTVAKPAKHSKRVMSMSKNAVDHRKRKNIEENYRKKVCTLIDADILERVREEGGITPAGRMYKAAYTMLTRLRGQKNAGATSLRAENEALRAKIAEAAELLRSFLEQKTIQHF
ncbi:uncharacterized protein Z518_02644 [Rhinocladiella mackenziei CBS 650.93]|uniref:Uncharacterized protein n=1 Tax=Rhinocladiella mackenziei CBS 650.93 TaxID=1442369 RepID=A0A0D2JFG7_9EURO|nr:uncharacterized protein Z518_02644 [Rhinocladiella mackenziei CBS 650.93]KIX07990.1 hypothetical protein Z518_02644 [Rhinocladiella mackenziei CBS 650.93]